MSENTWITIERDIKYEGITYSLHYNRQTGKFEALSTVAKVEDEIESVCVFLMECEIDKFLEHTPQTWEDLAKQIEDTLVWIGYESCYVDENVIRPLIKNFVKAGFHE